MTDAINPELTRWTGPHGLPRFDLIADADILPGIRAAMTAGIAAHDAIAANPAAPDFANTIEAMERADEALDRALAVFFTLSGSVSTPEREEIQRTLAPELSAHSSAILGNAALFRRIEAVWDGRDALSPAEARLTELTRRGFVRGGAALDEAGRARMAAIRSRLATLSTQFTQNLLHDEREYALPVPDDRMGGIPAPLAQAMRQAAADRGLPGQVVTVGRSLIVPFLEAAEDRALRETAQRAWEARGSGQGAGGSGTDNLPIAAEILALRHERAQLLGFPDYAAFKLDPEMAREAGNVEALLAEVWGPAAARVAEDEAALTALAREDGVNGPLEAWDWRYYAARRRRAEHAVDDSAIKPYLTLDGMIAAAFEVANRLFGLTIEPFEAPLWHEDVRAWRILRDGREMAVFLGDYFARPGKRSGAWCSALQMQHRMDVGQRAIVVNVCNFTKPAPGETATLGWDEAGTLFHEFGHALHHILSDVTWPSISGTSVARDFVELPSQLFEHWLEVPEIIEKHARHAETGAPRAIPMRHATPQFAHVFAGDGYAAGYYSYLWSEVMDADAYDAFLEAGDPFDPETAARLERAILSQGGLRPADELWLEFRERKPGVAALMRGRGLTPIVREEGVTET